MQFHCNLPIKFSKAFKFYLGGITSLLSRIYDFSFSFFYFFLSFFFFEQFNVSVQFCFRHNIAKWSLFLLISDTDKIWFGVEITAGQRPNFSFCSSRILYYYRNSFFFWTTATEFVRGTLKPLANASFL